MTTRTTIPSQEGCGFPHGKIARFIQALRDAQFSGQLIWISANRSQWSFYFHSGYLCYATGGTHVVRRWVRNVATYCPQFPIHMAQLQQELSHSAADFRFGWEYYLFCQWVTQHKLPRIQAIRAIQSIFSEVLIDLLQAQNLTYQIKQMSSTPQPLVALDEQKAVVEAERLWQNLRNYNITVDALNKAPIVKHPDRLQGSMPAGTCQTLPQLLDGEKTLRDLAVQTQINVVQVARFLLPYIQAEWVELVHVSDLPAPVHPAIPKQVTTAADSPLIACIDDSAIVCWTMEQLLTTAGYRFISINNGFRAITKLLQQKPSLIFLDVFMPSINGYEICRKLRKAPSFQQTPIVFLTGLDGVVDQVRARLAGASDFLSKPIDAEQVLHVAAKHLSQATIV